MKSKFSKVTLTALILLVAFLVIGSDGCDDQEDRDRRDVNKQQELYATAQPIPYFDYSQARDVYKQIYTATNEARHTHTIIESVMGATRFDCPSIGYGIPADTSLTNPVRRDVQTTIEQAEPNGLFSSKNTDGTWILCVGPGGALEPIYTEHKITTFPYRVEQDELGVWHRKAGAKASTTIKLSKAAVLKKVKKPEGK